MLAAILPVLNVLTTLLPLIGTATAGAPNVGSVLAILEQFVPLAINEGPALVAPIQKFIADLKSTGTPTDVELAQLDAYDDQLDAAFEAAAAAAGDPAPLA